MAKKYDSFIELTPGYESVVDIGSDSRNADFWSRYIVNDDMVTAVRLLAKSLRPDDPNEDVWHFWIKGSYGTGKTYSSIVIKHLLQDDYKTVDTFLTKNSLFYDVKDKFLSARKKGSYYVKFRSGECKQLNTSNKLLFQIEQSVREILQENGFKYSGRNSLIDSVKERVKDFKPKLLQDFEDGAYPEYWGTYSCFDDFYDRVLAGDVVACSSAQEILQSMNIGLATDLETFKSWMRDIFAGNERLSQTGIFIIWDEFTEYIRYNDLDIIQQLSIFSKEVPFFIIYVMHEYPGVFSENVSAGLGKADARFHKIDVSLSEKTTLKLIGESIITRDGMKDGWKEICDELYSSISGNLHSFMGDPGSDLDAATLKKIFPIHPMTVNLVSKVAGLAASNRSIFEFLKSSGDDGFRAYIHNNGQYDWKWVTPDYLWDYFFVNNQGGKKDITKTAEDALKHYNKVKAQISDERVLRVFKGAMLLLATIGSGHSLKKSKASRGVQSTEKTLRDCFAGMLNKEEVADCLKLLSSDPLNVLVLAPDIHEGARIELPYSGTGGELEAEVERVKKENTPSKLLNSDGGIGAVLKKQFVPEERAVVKRLIVDTCWGTTQQINYKIGELKKLVEKTYHKFGLMLIVAPSVEEIEKIKTTVNTVLGDDDNKRLLICILRYPLQEEVFKNLYELRANANLAIKSANAVNANSYNSQAADVVGTWVSTALGKDMDLIYANVSSHYFTNKAILSAYEKIVVKVFPAAPESIMKKITLYKTPALAPTYFGVSKTTLSTKSPSNDKQKSFNQQWQDCVDVLRDNDGENVWDCTSIEDIMKMEETKVGRSMAALCSLLNKSLTSGTVFLTELWNSLQEELGYYDTSVCCYLIGFAMHFYIGKYTWFDGNNSHKLDEDTLTTLIYSMLTGKAAGMKLSSESDIEKRFKDITQRVFSLSADEIGDVYDCRKNIKIHITESGYPLWALKYLDDEEYAGIKTELSEIIDKYVDFILEIGNQSNIIEDIVGLIKQQPRIYVKNLNELFREKNKLATGMRNFVYLKAPETQVACSKYGFSMDALITMLGRVLEEEKWQWKEQEVTDAAEKLTLDLTMVGIVNEVFEGTAESVEKVRETLANYLNCIRVPGCVYAGLEFPWSKTVSILYDISLNKWVSYSRDEKEDVIRNLELYMSEAIDNISHPKGVLRSYVEKNGMGAFSETEYDEILRSLPQESYSQTEHTFKTNIQNKINDLSYTKKVNELLLLWKTKTGRDNISSWTTEHIMPIEWVMPDQGETFTLISALELHERVDSIRLENALSCIDKTDYSILLNDSEIDKLFIVNVSSKKYTSLLLPHIAELKERIQKRGYRDYAHWNNDLVAIRPIVEEYIAKDLKSEVSDKAKQRIGKINDVDELREQLNRILEQSSEACLLLLDGE